MYAVIKTGGKQYRVKAGDVLVVEKLDGDVGAQVSFDQVLMMGEGKDVVVGAPAVAGASVTATLVETRKGDKIKVFKKIRRQGYRRTQGHRQFETVLRVTSVAGGGKESKWDGTVDLTPRSVLNARARNLPSALAAATAPAATAKPVKAAAPKAAPKAAAPKAKAEPKTEAPKAAAKPAAPKAAAAPKTATAPKAKAAAPKTAAKPAAKTPKS